MTEFRPDASAVWLAAISVALAALFWAYTVSELKSVKDVTVPLQFANVPKDLIVVGEDARKTITVEFKGPPDMLKRVREEDVDARIDVGKLDPGPQVVELGQENVRLPSSVEFVRTCPKLVHFTLDRRLRDTLPLQPSFTGRAAAGLQVLSWTIDPPSVQVEGPESVMRKLKRLPTQPVPLDGRTADFETPVVPDLLRPRPDGPVTRAPPRSRWAWERSGPSGRSAPVPVRVLHARSVPSSSAARVHQGHGGGSRVPGPALVSAEDVCGRGGCPEACKPPTRPTSSGPPCASRDAGLAGKVQHHGLGRPLREPSASGPARRPPRPRRARAVRRAGGRPLP